MEQTKRSADLVLALGTSLSGMAADQVALDCAIRHEDREEGVLGLVIVSLQRTQHDEHAALRIYAPLDDVVRLLAEQLQLVLPTKEGIRLASENPARWYEHLYCASNTLTTRETLEEMRTRAG